MAMSFYILTMTIVGLGLGPYAVGLISDLNGGDLGAAISSLFWLSPPIALLTLFLVLRFPRDEAAADRAGARSGRNAYERPIDDAVAAAAFRRLVAHLRHRAGCAEYRPDGARRLLPQLPRRLGRRGFGGARAGRSAATRRGARSTAWTMPTGKQGQPDEPTPRSEARAGTGGPRNSRRTRNAGDRQVSSQGRHLPHPEPDPVRPALAGAQEDGAVQPVVGPAGAMNCGAVRK